MTNSKKPKVSIIMCAYNNARYLPEAIQSVLAQDFHDWELIILDDASVDDTESVVDQYRGYERIRYIKNDENLGLAGNRNAGLKEARGEYVAILDSDDRWTDTTKLSRQVSFLNEHGEYGVVGTFVNTIDEDGKKIADFIFEITDELIRDKMLLRNQFANSTVLFRNKIAVDAGRYDESLAPAEDYDLFLRIGKNWKFANIPEMMADYRIHENNTSGKNKKAHAKLHLSIIKKYKRDYPNYFKALIKAYLRILVK